MANGWSGGQYSVFRFLLGLYVLLDLMRCVGSDDQLLSAMSLLGIVLCVLLMVGWMDRPAASALVLMGLVLVVAGGDRSSRTLLMGGPSLWFLLPVIAVVVPPAPYGSLSAKGRSDPAGSWEMGQGLYLAIWLSLCGGYAGLGLDLVLDPSWWSSRGMRIGNTSDWPVALGAAANWLLVGTWLAFAPLALVSKLRQWVWLVAMIEAVVVLPLAGLGLHLFVKGRSHYDRARAAALLRCPLLVLHGTDDAMGPLESARRIAAAAPQGRLVTIEGGGHLDLARVEPVRYRDALTAFFGLLGAGNDSPRATPAARREIS